MRAGESPAADGPAAVRFISQLHATPHDSQLAVDRAVGHARSTPLSDVLPDLGRTKPGNRKTGQQRFDNRKEHPTLTLDHIQGLNLHALLGAQRGDVSTIRTLWPTRQARAQAEQEKVIELKREFAGGREWVLRNPAHSLPPRGFDFTTPRSLASKQPSKPGRLRRQHGPAMDRAVDQRA